MALYRISLVATAVVCTLTLAHADRAWSKHDGPASHARSPIRHLIVVVGENRSFDNVFGAYTPNDPSQKVWNLLSQGIVLNDLRTMFDLGRSRH